MTIKGVRASDWMRILGYWTVTDEYLECQPPVDELGKRERCEIRYVIPQGGAWDFDFSFDVTSDDLGGMIFVVDEIVFEPGLGDVREAILLNKTFIEEFAPQPAPKARKHRIGARSEGSSRDDRYIVFSVDGQDIFRWAYQRYRPFGGFQMRIFQNARVDNFKAEFRQVVPRAGQAPKKDFLLSCTVDFLDDIRRCKWTPDMVRDYLRLLQQMGVKRVYWEDYMRHPLPEVSTNPKMYEAMKKDLQRDKVGVWPTLSQGWDDFTVGAKIAKELGMEVYALIKPFDWHYYEPTDPTANYYPSMKFLHENQDKIMSRRPRAENYAADNATIGTIRLVNHTDKPFEFAPGDIELWISDDQKTYRKYEGPLEIHESVEPRTFIDWWTQKPEAMRSVRVLTLSKLQITAASFALHGRTNRRTLRNRLYRLTEMLSTDGRPMEFTYGCEVKPQGPTPDGSMPLKYVVDHIGGVPTARLSGREAIEDYFTIDADRWLVYLRGGLRGSRRNWVALCPAYPEVRENWFMRLVRHALDAGADGIDLRAPDAHQRCMTWTERNFNPPMIEAYKARYGVDPSREPYDRAKFAQLGGEFYEQFLEQAAMLCHSKGKKVQHHIYNHRDATGQDRPSMNLYVDWRKWIDRGWVDEVTLKELFPSMPLFHEVMTKCREFDIKTHFCPYLNTLMGSQKWVGPDPEYRNASRDYKPALTDLIRHARQQGCDGMLLYEAGTFLTGMADETVQFMWEGIPQTLHAAMKQ